MSTIRQLLLICLLSLPAFAQGGGNLGLFSNSGDVGTPAIKGSAEFSDGQYRVTGSGVNIWGKRDQFQYVWREISGDFTVTASMHFVGEGAEHRKAGIMVRQSLAPDSAYADVLVHGSGMPALQWRSKPGDDTNTFDLPIAGPGNGTFRVKLVRAGVKMYLYIATDGAEPKKIANTEVSFNNPVLVGLVVCAHQPNAAATVVFSDVSVEAQPPATTPAKAQ